MNDIYNILKILFLMLLVINLAGCDGYLGVEGRVYESVQTTSDDKGIVLIDNIDKIPPAGLDPVKGAEIIVEPWTTAERKNFELPEPFIKRETTNETGYFKAGTTAKPGSYTSTLTVRCRGYIPVVREFKHDRFWHKAIIILVREK